MLSDYNSQSAEAIPTDEPPHQGDDIREQSRASAEPGAVAQALASLPGDAQDISLHHPSGLREPTHWPVHLYLSVQQQ